MIEYLGCEHARPMLQAFVDLELPVADQVMLESHLRWCDTCAAHVEDLRLIGAGLRLRAARPRIEPEDAGALFAIESAVLARVRAEQEQSWPARFRAWFADMRLLWPALGATAALIACLTGAASVNRIMRAEHPDSMADRIAALASPGSDRNPLQLDGRMLAPRPLTGGLTVDLVAEDDAVFALAAVVTREGRVANFELLHASGHAEIGALLDAAQWRFAPARTPDGAVAVNVVWLLARTTVRGSINPNDSGSLQPLTAPERPRRPSRGASISEAAPTSGPRPARS